MMESLNSYLFVVWVDYIGISNSTIIFQKVFHVQNCIKYKLNDNFFSVKKTFDLIGIIYVKV